KYAPLNESNIYRKLHLNDIKASIHQIHILLHSDFVNKYNPISSYFERIGSLWDTNIHGDYIAHLASYLSVNRRDQFIKHLKKWMIRAVVCSHNSLYYNKQAFILVGEEQNTGKSSFMRFLCPPELSDYMTENISTDKDGLIALTENFLINMDELSTMSRYEINALKSVFSKDKVKVRLPFDRRASTLPRLASFMGSTNKTQFLNDETGSVRFINFEVDRIDWNYAREIDINIAWSQAYQLWKSNFTYELSSAEIQENEQVNNQYKLSSPELELILKHFIPGTIDGYQFFWTASEILNFLLEHTHTRMRLSTINIGKALKMAGFKQGQKRTETFPVRGYYINVKN
ncbi:MAG: virulence protein E, partial [Cyclobacteriaceae bacterium]|nr:virulence protein E [Cyclobacteriaceae bacterium]